MEQFKIKLSEEDFVTYYLFKASRSKSTRTKRVRNWLVISGLFFAIGSLFYQTDNDLYGYTFCFFGLLTFILYPFYDKQQYRRYYLNYIRENFGNRIDKESTLAINSDQIQISSIGYQGRIEVTEIEKINETFSHIFMELKSGDTLIIPKKIDEYQKLNDKLEMVAMEKGISWNKDLKWKGTG